MTSVKSLFGVAVFLVLQGSLVSAQCLKFERDSCNVLVNHSITECSNILCDINPSPEPFDPTCPENTVGYDIKEDRSADVFRDIFYGETGSTSVTLSAPVVCLTRMPCTGCTLDVQLRIVCQQGSPETAEETYYELTPSGFNCP